MAIGRSLSTTHAAANAPRVASAGHVTVIVLDMSGSMSANDPNGLRCSAANAYIDLSGPGDYVGVIGLDSPTGARGGAHNYVQAVDWGLAPRELATVAARQTLRTAIQQKSNNCRPDAATPTYDSLVKAKNMLAAATQGGKIGGSMILLTDGVPDPDTSSQIGAIRSDLVPQFKAHNWPIDTIALGVDQSFHGFLSDLASATSGRFYDDGHGVVSGVSPLNITPFFLDIFKVRNGRSPGPDIPPTTLSGATARNFSVGQYVSHLDVVVIKDTPATQVSIVAPNGQRFPPAAAGTFISTDPHYAIFAIDTPQQGAWEVDVSGSGLFLMDSLKVSTLALALTSPDPTKALALGEPITITAQLTNQGTPVSGGHFTISGTLTYVGGDGASQAQDIELTDASGSGNYTATITLPTSAPPGSYALAITARAASEDVLSAQTVVRFALFPAALLISPATNKPTTETVSASVVGWDAILRAIYRLPVLSWISGLPLDGHAADPTASVRGQVFLLDKAYAQATVTGVALRAGTTQQLPVTVVNDGGGAFHLLFPTGASGTYAVTLTTTGAFNISHGDLTHVVRTVQATITPATQSQEIRAWILTGVYLLLLILLILVVRALSAPAKVGMLASTSGDGGEEFARAKRGPLAALLHPNVVTSKQMGLDPGLRFRFHRGGRITVQGTGQRNNYLLNGDPVPRAEVSASEARLTTADGEVAYTISSAAGRDGDEAPTAAGWRSEVGRKVLGRSSGRNDEEEDYSRLDDDDDDNRRRGRFSLRRRGRDDDDGRGSWRDDDDRPTKQSRRGARRGRDDDDW